MAFQKMDTHLDLRMDILGNSILDYPKDEFFGPIWTELTPGKTKIIEDGMFWRNDSKLYFEKKICIPKENVPKYILWAHTTFGHPSAERTFWHFNHQFYSSIPPKELLSLAKNLIQPCKTCCEAKPNTQSDRGLVGALPIPPLINDMIFVDFVQVDEYQNFDYVLTIVDGLSRFCRFFPCKKTINGEKAFKIIFEGWIQVYGLPREVISDNDVRFTSEVGWWRSTLESLGVKVTFTQPRHPQSNGLCERTNRKFLQTMRIFMHQQTSRDWLRLIPYVTWVLNNQINPQTQYTPHELFFGRPTFALEVPPEPTTTPLVQEWVLEHSNLCARAQKNLQKLRARRLKRANRGRVDATYKVGDLVLVHRKRFPQWPLNKLSPQWFGPFKIIPVHHNTVLVRASPRLGGGL